MAKDTPKKHIIIVDHNAIQSNPIQDALTSHREVIRFTNSKTFENAFSGSLSNKNITCILVADKIKKSEGCNLIQDEGGIKVKNLLQGKPIPVITYSSTYLPKIHNDAMFNGLAAYFALDYEDAVKFLTQKALSY